MTLSTVITLPASVDPDQDVEEIATALRSLTGWFEVNRTTALDGKDVVSVEIRTSELGRIVAALDPQGWFADPS